MKIPPDYFITPEILKLISEIEAEKIYFSRLKVPKETSEKIQRISLLKSSLFSARIEGNPLELADLAGKAPEDKKLEVYNILEASRFIGKDLKKGNLTKGLVLNLHKLVLKQIQPDAGFFRSEPSAIFNQAGVAVYISPSPAKIHALIDGLFLYINDEKEKFPLIKAFIAHLIFEKIHPFLDGNGRVGRLLIAAILKHKGWQLPFTIPFEEYIDANKDLYYFHLDSGIQKAEDFLIFMLTGFLEGIKSVRNQIDEELGKKGQFFLPPRQEEIYNTIKDHKVCSFNMIRRRFLLVPERTLRFDLKKLFDKGLIEKTGETRGRYYRVKNDE